MKTTKIKKDSSVLNSDNETQGITHQISRKNEHGFVSRIIFTGPISKIPKGWKQGWFSIK